MSAEPSAGRNWAGNVAYSARRSVTPSTLAELAEIVRSSGSVKAVGSRHCFNTIADTEGVHVSLRDFGPDVSIDADRRVVRTGAGIRYGDLAAELQRQGWALSNLASLPHISVAGAVATGTHGSGDTVRSLAAGVRALDVMTADGDLVSFGPGADDLGPAVVSLGALGIVTEVELEIEPTYEVAQTVYERLPLDAVLADLSAVTGLAYSTSLFTTWQDPDVIDQLWLKRRPDTDPAPPAHVLGAEPAPVQRHPLPGQSPESTTEQLGVAGPWLARLPHFRLEFTPSNGDELQSEYLVPREHAVAAIGVVRALASDVAPLLQVCELRTVAADELALSPASGRDVLGIHFTWKPDQPAVERLLVRLEEGLAPLSARPHWGKVFTVETIVPRLTELYPEWDRFVALRDRLDPRGVFRNAFLERLGL